MVETMVSTGNRWLSFKDVERETGIPGTTLRRFAERFPAYLPGKRIDRALCFHCEAVATFRRIHELYRNGKQTPEIMAIIATELAPTLDVKPIPTNATTVPTVSSSGDLAPMVASFAQAVDRLAGALERQNELQSRSVEALERRLAVLEAMVAKVPADSVPNASKQPWWRRWIGGGGNRGE